MKRVDLADLLAKARACGAANGATRCISAPHRDGLFDVLSEQDGAEIYERCLLADAEFAVAAQPAVVEALALRIQELEEFIRITFLGNSLRADDMLTRGIIVPGYGEIVKQRYMTNARLVELQDPEEPWNDDDFHTLRLEVMERRNAMNRSAVRAIVREAMRKAATLAAFGALGNHPDFDVVADEATRDICGLEVTP